MFAFGQSFFRAGCGNRVIRYFFVSECGDRFFFFLSAGTSTFSFSASRAGRISYYSPLAVNVSMSAGGIRIVRIARSARIIRRFGVVFFVVFVASNDTSSDNRNENHRQQYFDKLFHIASFILLFRIGSFRSLFAKRKSVFFLLYYTRARARLSTQLWLI